MKATTPAPRLGAHVALIGLGNIGSQALPLLAGVGGITRVSLVDPDRYEASNLGHQRLAPADVGRRKVDIGARLLRRLAPQWAVQVHACRIESLPLGLLRGCTMLGAVDSRLTRQAISGRALALGVPWVDAALGHDGAVRARAYVPGGDCLECAWGDPDYRLLEQRLPCAAPRQMPPTAAPPELGALAASLQVSLLRRLLAGEDVGGQQRFYDAGSGRGFVGRYARHPQCRAEHRPWQIHDLAPGAAQLTLRAALGLADGGRQDGAALSLPGHTFVRRLRCLRCGRVRRRLPWRADGRLRAPSCRGCGGGLTATAADVTDALGLRNMPPALADGSLAAFGLVDGDVFGLQSRQGTQHFQLGGASRSR